MKAMKGKSKMKFIKMTLVGIGGVAVAALLLTPKTAHALVAALVQVTNTTANPVPNLDTERNARIPYQSAYVFSQSTTGDAVRTITFTAVPSGYRLVAQNASANLTLAAGSTGAFGALNADGNFYLGLPVLASGPLGTFQGFNYQI